MIIKSFKSLVRTPVKTALFVTLLAAVTIVLCIGVNMWLSVNNSLEAASQAFRTIGVVEYRDPDREYVNDYHMYNYDFSPITNSPFVQSFDQRVYLSGFSEDISISQAINTSRSGYTDSVIEFTPIEISNDSLYKSKIEKVLHSRDFDIKEGAIILIQINGYEDCSLELGKRYITSVYGGWDPNLPDFYCVIREIAVRNYWGIMGYQLNGYANFDEVVMEVTGKDYLEHGVGQMWADLIQMYKNSLKTATVLTTNDLETILIFHQGNVMVSSGRTFSSEDYQEGSPVCLISDKMATLNGLGLGDSISLTFSDPSIGVRPNRVMSADSINHRNIVEEVSFEIIGLYQVVGEMAGAYGLWEDTIFIPQESINYWPDEYTTMDNQVSFRLTNGKVEAFLGEMEQHDLPGVNFTFYDQGYSKISGALASMKETALLLTGICAAAGLGIILLFSLLYVGRQKRSIAIMYSLGTSRNNALAFLLITVLMVSGLAVTIGGIAGYTLSDKVLEEVYARNSQENSLSVAYSEVYGEDNVVDFQAITPEKPIAPLTVAGTVLVVTLIMSGIFATKALRSEPMQVLTEKEE